MITPPPPRTDTEPFAFTRKEFARGAFMAWVIFMALLFAALVLSALLQRGDPESATFCLIFVYLVYGIPVGAAVSAVVTIVGSPLAWAIGRSLRQQRKIMVHVVAYLALGAGIGLSLVGGSALLGQGDLDGVFSAAGPWAVAAVCAASVVGGWSTAIRRATREDARRLARAERP